MTPEEIDAQLQQGQSLADIAASGGISEDSLVAAIIKPMQDFMQQQVSAGSLTQQQLGDRLKLADQHIRQFVNSKGTSADSSSGGCGGSGMMSGSGIMAGSSSMMGASGNASATYRGGMMGGSAQTY